MYIYVVKNVLISTDRYNEIITAIENKLNLLGSQPDSVVIPYEIRKVGNTSNGSVETIIMLLGAHSTQYINVIKNVFASYELAHKNNLIRIDDEKNNLIRIYDEKNNLIRDTTARYIPEYFNIPTSVIGQCPMYISAGAYINDARSPVYANTYDQCMLNIECVLQIANDIDSAQCSDAEQIGGKQIRLSQTRVYTCITPSKCTTASTSYASGNAHLNHLAILALRLKSTGNRAVVVIMDHMRPDGTINILNNRDIPIISIYRENGPTPLASPIKESGPAPECIQLGANSGDVDFTRAVMKACDYLKKYCGGLSMSMSNLINNVSNVSTVNTTNNTANANPVVLVVYMPHDIKRKFNVNNMQMCGKQIRAATNCKFMVVITDLSDAVNHKFVNNENVDLQNEKNYITEFVNAYDDTVNGFIMGNIVF